MKTYFKNSEDYWYTAWAIAAKDIGEALKYKTTRMNIIAALGLVLFSTWGAANRFGAGYLFSEVVVYDESNSQLSAAMENSPDLELVSASSLEELKSLVDSNEIGLVIPQDFDRQVNSSGQPTLNGYVSWAERHKVADMEVEFTREFSDLIGRPLRVEIGDNVVTPRPDSRGAILDVATTMLLAVFWMAVTVMPHVMLEEKQTRTIDALLVSPASEGQVVAGKALVGLFYTVATAGLALALNWNYIAHWGLALLAFLAATLLAISVALMLGSFINSDQHLNLWVVPTIIIIVLPAILLQFGDGLPTGLSTALPWIPSAAVVNLFRHAFSNDAPVGQLLFDLTVVLAAAALLYALVVWKLRRADR